MRRKGGGEVVERVRADLPVDVVGVRDIPALPELKSCSRGLNGLNVAVPNADHVAPNRFLRRPVDAAGLDLEPNHRVLSAAVGRERSRGEGSSQILARAEPSRQARKGGGGGGCTHVRQRGSGVLLQETPAAFDIECTPGAEQVSAAAWRSERMS